MSDERWVVHVIGPDDVIDQPDEITALRTANELNRSILSIEREEHDPFVMAVVKDANSEAL